MEPTIEDSLGRQAFYTLNWEKPKIIVSELSRGLPQLLLKHYIHFDFKPNDGYVQSVLYLYFGIYFVVAYI